MANNLGMVLTNRSAIDRSKTDFYPTPPDVTIALLDFLESHEMLDPKSMRIWEPACGTGDMAEVMKARGYEVECTDLHETGYGTSGVDFMTNDRCWYDWIITNPPFSQTEKFIRHALDLRRPCAFLVKSQFWHAKSRVEIFWENRPSYVLPLTWRPDFLRGAKGGSPTMECCWTVWNGLTNLFTEYVPLERPKGGNAHG